MADKVRARKADIISTNYGTILAIAGNTKRGRQWLRAHVDGARNCNDCVSAEHRYGIDILQGAIAAGLQLQDSATGRRTGGQS